jgi:hypothetical protein
MIVFMAIETCPLATSSFPAPANTQWGHPEANLRDCTYLSRRWDEAGLLTPNTGSRSPYSDSEVSSG